MKGKITYKAWTRGDVTVYTVTEEAAAGDKVYSGIDTDSGRVVEETGFGYIKTSEFGSPRYDRNDKGDMLEDMFRPIVTPTEMLELTRLEYTDTDKLVPLIREVERHIKDILGDELYIRIVSNPRDHAFDTLMEGGVYESGCGKRSFEGLKTAAAYYAFAKACKSDIVPTRYGNADKRSEYSYHSALTEKQKLIRETLEIADRHLQDCLDYIFTATEWICPCKAAVRFVSSHSLRFRIIDGEPKRRRCTSCGNGNQKPGPSPQEHRDYNEDYNEDYD